MRQVAADTLTLLRRELLRYRRDRAYWVGQIVFPLAVIGVAGFGLRNAEWLQGAAYSGGLASGILVLLVGSGAVGGGFSLIEDRDSGFLRALLVAPVSRTSIVLGKLGARIVVSLLMIALLVVPLTLLTPIRLPHPGGALLAVVGVTAFFVALGIALATQFRRLESFRTFAALATVPLYLLSGIIYPLASLPALLRLAAYANPMTYGADLLRWGLLGVHELPVGLSAAMLTGRSALSVAAAVVLFERGART